MAATPPNLTASSSAASGAYGGAAYGGATGEFNVTQGGMPWWGWLIAAGGLLLLLWPRTTRR